MSNQTIVYPIQIRPEVTVKLHLPADLTKEEAEKIGRILIALATTEMPPPAIADDQ